MSFANFAGVVVSINPSCQRVARNRPDSRIFRLRVELLYGICLF